MVACAFGATRATGKPKYYRVTEADIERWYPGAGAIFYLWMRPFVGRVYDTEALAILNPDVPATAGWQDFLADALHGWGLAGTSTLSTVAENQIQYFVFLENCVCSAGVGSWTLLNTWSFVNNSTGWTDDANPQSATPGQAYKYTVEVTSHSGSSNMEIYGDFRNSANALNGACYATYPFFIANNPDGMRYDPGLTQYIPVSTVVAIRWKYHMSSAGSANITVRFYRWDTGAGPPSTPPQPTWTGLPAYTPPTGTTNDQLEVKLDALVNMVASMADWTKATQRQSVPFAYIPGPVHAGLSGTGQIAVADLLGLAVHFTSIPARLPVSAGTPDQIWELGHVSLGTADGWQRNITLTHNPALVVPVSGFVTKVGYTLPLGVVATITELKAEP